METNKFNLNNLPKYFVGQKLICINECGWINFDNSISTGPAENETVTFMGFGPEGGLVLKGYEDEWYSEEFVPSQESELKTISYSKIIEKELISLN